MIRPRATGGRLGPSGGGLWPTVIYCSLPVASRRFPSLPVASRRFPSLPVSDAAPEDDRTGRMLRAAVVFTPRVPISRVKNLAGRPDQISRVLDAVRQQGAHAIVYGERGVGKTSLAECLPEILEATNGSGRPSFAPRVNCNTHDSFDTVWRKVFGKLEVVRREAKIGFAGREDAVAESILAAFEGREVVPEDVRRELFEYGSQSLLAIILDEFDSLRDDAVIRLVADTIKTLSDGNVPVTLVIVGVGDSVTDLIRGHESVGRHLVEVPVPRMPPREQREIVTSRLPALGLGITSEALDLIPAICRGLPFYVHLLGQKAAQAAIRDDESVVDRASLAAAVTAAVADSERALRQAYLMATASAQRNTFPQTLSACALAPTDEFGYFTPKSVCEPLAAIQGAAAGVDKVNPHLVKFTSEDRGAVLQQTGQRRNFRYRFRDPLMEPFVLMKSLGDGLVTLDQIAARGADA